APSPPPVPGAHRQRALPDADRAPGSSPLNLVVSSFASHLLRHRETEDVVHMVKTYEIDFGGRKLTIETGKLAEQADGAVTIRLGDTIVLSAVTGAREPREGADFFPLTVDYEERTYA